MYEAKQGTLCIIQEMMCKITVSVCISVFNTEDYLERALDSVVVQGIEGIEIILVNNGSTDNSETIMWDYKSKHPDIDIKIFSQNDRGLAQGRQTGINHATGEYITFLDADDYLLPGAYKKILHYIQSKEADIYEFQTSREGRTITSPYVGTKSTKAVLGEYLAGKYFPTMLWLRWYKKELFGSPVLPEFYVNNEDNFAFPCLLYRANTIEFIPEVLHVYSTDNENGVMLSFENNKAANQKYYENRKKVLLSISHINNYIGKENLEMHYHTEFIKFQVRTLLNFLFTSIEGISYEQKMLNIIESTKFCNIPELENFIRKYCRFNCKMNLIIKAFGVRKAYSIYQGRRGESNL